VEAVRRLAFRANVVIIHKAASVLQPVHVHAASPVTPSDLYAAQTRLSARLWNVQTGQQHLTFPEDGTRRMVFPAYWGGLYESPWELIKDQQTFDQACATVEACLNARPLREDDMLDILQSGILRRPLGRQLAPRLVEAMMDSVVPTGNLTIEQLRQIVEVICYRAPDDWVNAFGERLNFPRGANGEGVAGFIQAQLDLSRLQREEQIANRERLTNEQWHCLQQAVKNCRPCIGPWLEGRSDSDPERIGRVHDTLCKLEDFLTVRPHSQDAKRLLGELRDRLQKVENFPSAQQRAIDDLWHSIESKSAPSLLEDFKTALDPVQLRAGVQRWVNDTNWAVNALGAFSFKNGLSDVGSAIAHAAGFVFRNTAEPEPEPVPISELPEQQADSDCSLIEILEEIERTGDYYENVLVNRTGVPDGLAARILYAANIGYVSGVLQIAGKIHLPAQSAPVLETPTSLFEQIAHLAEQIDTLFTQTTGLLTGWQPVAAEDMTAPHALLQTLKDTLNDANLRTPLRETPTSRYGTEGNPYADTVVTLEQETSSVESLRTTLAHWLQTAAGYLAAAGLTTFNTARQHPRAAATLSMAAIYGVVLEFYEHWFPDSAAPPHFVHEADPDRRGQIANEVESTLKKMPALTEMLRERIANSADPHSDPALVEAVEGLLEQPVPWSPNITSATLIEDSIQHAQLHSLDSPGVDTDDIHAANDQPLGSTRKKREAAEWTLEAMVKTHATAAADSDLQGSVIEQMHAKGNVPLPIPEHTLIHPPVELYRQALDDKALVEFFNAKGLSMSTLRINHHSVSGPVTLNGVTTLRTFDHWDNSGWWQVSSKLLPVLKLLDPDDFGLSVVNQASNAIPPEVVLKFYGVDPPSSEPQAKALAGQLKKDGWPAFTEARKARLEKATQQVQQGIEEHQRSSRLSSVLELIVKDKPDNATLTSSNITPDQLQMIRIKGFDAPRTVGEVRNIIRWLTTSLPPSPSLGNYGVQLLADEAIGVSLSSGDKALLIELAKTFADPSPSIIDALAGDSLRDKSVEDLRANADVLLRQMLDSQQADGWGEQCVNRLNWFGAAQGQMASAQQYQQLLLAAIRLTVDPSPSGKSASVAGYDVYQAKNRGRELSAIRDDIERHLIGNRGVSAQSAPLVAHLFLAGVAPEFLVHEGDARVSMGSANWMTLRLGVAIAEATNPGCSRGMTGEQLMALAVLDPASNENRLLFQSLGVDIMVAWGVMNGVIRQRLTSAYSPGDYVSAAKSFARQRAEVSSAFQSSTRRLQSRRAMAIDELRKVFPRASVREIEEKKLWSNHLDPYWNTQAMKGSNQDLVEVYLAGDLKPGDWMLLTTGNFADFESKIRQLPNVDKVFSAAVDKHFENFKQGFIAPTKLLFAELPLEDRQCLESGKVEVFTLREETGKFMEVETPELRAAFRGQYARLIRCEYRDVRYFEVFPTQMKIIKRADLPDVLPLDGQIRQEKARLSKGSPVTVDVQRGTSLAFDFQAYSTGIEPRANVESPRLIIEKMGDSLPASTPVGYEDETTYVPNSYYSSKIATIVNRLLDDNFLQGQKTYFFNNAKGISSREEQNAFWQKIREFVVRLVPFVGCVSDLNSGTRVGLVNGAFGCLTDAVSSLFGLSGGAGKIASVVRSISPVRVKAFEAFKITGGSVLSVINPLSGLPDLVAGSARGLRRFGNLITSGVFDVTQNGLGRLQAGIERVRCFVGGMASSAAGPVLPSWIDADPWVKGVRLGINVTAIRDSERWYAVDPEGLPFGPPLTDFVPL
jgi:hypothetical protein